jgi:hypothetical protein
MTADAALVGSPSDGPGRIGQESCGRSLAARTKQRNEELEDSLDLRPAARRPDVFQLVVRLPGRFFTNLACPNDVPKLDDDIAIGVHEAQSPLRVLTTSSSRSLNDGALAFEETRGPGNFIGRRHFSNVHVFTGRVNWKSGAATM